MKTLFGMLAVLVLTNVANAQDSSCTQVGDGKSAWICPVPEDMKIKCSGPVDGLLLCNRPIGEAVQNVNVTKPSNCGVRHDRYVCWNKK